MNLNQIKHYKMNPECDNPVCPVKLTLDIISGKYKILVLYRLLNGKKRFNELKRLLTPVTHRTLTLQLRDLERDGIIKRTIYPEIPPRVEYELTSLGFSMKPIIQALYDWGMNYKIAQEKKEVN